MAVLVGRGVAVGGRVGEEVGVEVGVSVGAGVSVGNGVGTKAVEVGNGVKVGKSKSNSPVGVTGVPEVGKILGLGWAVAGLPRRDSATGTEQRQQMRRNSRAGIRILIAGGCWL